MTTMNKYKQEELRRHLSDALDLLWVHYVNGFGTEKEKLIAEIQLEVERLDSTNGAVGNTPTINP
jgi:hypothetical protein